MHTIKHAEDVEADIDAEQRLVTLRVRNFDSQAVADFVTEVLPEHDAVAYRDEVVGHPTPFQLDLFLGGLRPTAQVVRLADGRTTVRLKESLPDEFHARGDAAAEHLRETGISYTVDEVLDEMRSMLAGLSGQLQPALLRRSGWRRCLACATASPRSRLAGHRHRRRACRHHQSRFAGRGAHRRPGARDD